jgi:hypothetical protein
MLDELFCFHRTGDAVANGYRDVPILSSAKIPGKI